MKALLIAGCLLCMHASAQDNAEFRDQPNGLMYSDASMKVLRKMVDSLNLRFKTCDLTRTYYSHPQARVYYVFFKSKTHNLRSVIKDLDMLLPFDSVVKKHRRLIDKKDTTRTCILMPRDEEDEFDSYLEGDPESGYDSHTVDSNARQYFNTGGLPNLKGKWMYYYSSKEEFDDEYSLYCRFFPEEFTQQQLPSKYAALIQYVDCMIDTNAKIFINQKDPNRFAESPQELLNVCDYIDKAMGREVHSSKYWLDLDDTLINYAVQHLKKDEKFLKLVNIAIDTCMNGSLGNDDFEELVANIISFDAALKLKRNRVVWGNCSQDQSPRIHARNIALLAAETNSWDIFLRSHLDIMNDRFTRVSDGSYAYGRRKTYLKELELLNLNIVDLMLGLSLHAQNLNSNHYLGTVWRLGWALTESKDRKNFEKRILEMMKDPQLDAFNQGLLFIMFSSYVHRLENKVEAAQLVNSIKARKHLYPKHMQMAITKLKTSTD